MDKVISRTISEIDKVKNENLELNDKLNRARAENERLQAEYDDLHLSYAGCKTANTGLKELNEELQAELQRYKDMEKKGLEEFKDIGGCWGCGIQLSLNQAWEDLKEYREKYENVLKLAKENADSNEYCLQELEQENEKLKEQLNKKDDLINDITNGGIQLQKECEMLKAENEQLKSALAIWENAAQKQTALKVVEVDKYRQSLQEIRDIATALYMNNWLQMNETAKESIKLLQAKINEVIGAEE